MPLALTMLRLAYVLSRGADGVVNDTSHGLLIVEQLCKAIVYLSTLRIQYGWVSVM